MKALLLNIKRILVNASEYFITAIFFSLTYFCIECVYKGKITDWRMGLLGGIIGLAVGLLNNVFTYETDILLQGLVGALITTLAEATLGYQWNIIEGLNIWDYSNLPFSAVNGQINLFFFIAWIFLSLVAVILDDLIDYYIFKNTQPPYYKLFGKTIFKFKGE